MSDVVQTGFLILGGATAYVCLGAVGACAAIAGLVALGIAGMRKLLRK